MTTLDPLTPPASKSTILQRRRTSVVALILGLLAIIVGTAWWLDAHQYESTDDAFIDTHMVRIAAQVAGRVLNVAVHDNQDIKKGDLLVEIDPADYQAKLDGALARQAAANSALAQTKAQLNAAQANVLEAQAMLHAAEAYAANTSTKDRRNKQLAEKLLISRQQLEDSAATTQVDLDMVDAAHKKADSTEAQVAVSESQIVSAEANIKSADAEVEQAQINIANTKIVAAQDGRVTQLNVAAGDYLEVGQQFVLIIPHELWVTANFKENQLDHIHPGQSAELLIDAYPDHHFQGHIDSIESGSGAAFSLLPPENATGNYIKIVQRVPVKIVFDGDIDPQFHLGPGMSVVPTVKIQ